LICNALRTQVGRHAKRDELLIVDDGRDGRTRSIRLTSAGVAKVKSAAIRWRKAQKEFELAFGADKAADLRSTLLRAMSAA